MGEVNKSGIAGFKGTTNGKTTTAENGSTGNTTSTSSAGGTSGGIAGGTSGGITTEEKGIPKLVTLDLPEQSKEDQKKEQKRLRDKARYEKRKAESGKAEVKKETSIVDENQIGVILSTITMIISARPNLSQWKLSDQEINQITTPLANIIKKSEKLSNVGEYADAIALAIACATIIIPRIIITIDNAKGAKNHVKSISALPTNKAGESKAVNHNDAAKHTDGQSTPSSSAVSPPLSSIIPAIA